jgi:predicted nucleotidyltransferase
MRSYKINFEQLRQRPEISGMLAALERGFEKFGIDFYLVGAVARDVWMSGINSITPRRTTGDLDFAVLVNAAGIYEELRDYLIRSADFQPTRENAFVLIWKDKTEVDLLPFGVIADMDGKLTISGIGNTAIYFPGLQEVYEQGLPRLELEGVHSFKFCSLPGIVILKLLAWDDRPELRRDDIIDISDILNHFFQMQDQEIWENHFDLFEEEMTDLRLIAARVMGREMSRIARRNEKLFSRIEGILHRNTHDLYNSQMADIMIAYFDNTVEDNVKLLQQLKQGFTE